MFHVAVNVKAFEENVKHDGTEGSAEKGGEEHPEKNGHNNVQEIISPALYVPWISIDYGINDRKQFKSARNW